MSKVNNYIVYINRDLNGEIFYVGCSKSYKRPYDKYSVHKGDPKRTIDWFERCNNRFTAEIVYENLSREIAYELEKLLIAKYGRVKYDKGGILVNQTIGGLGCNGVVRSKETIDKISKANKGRVNSEASKLRFRAAKLGSKNPRAKKVICNITGAMWSTAKDCAIGNNIAPSTLRGKLNGTRINNTNFRYLD